MVRHAGMVLALGSIFALGSAMPAWAHGTTERVSVSSGGAQADGASASSSSKPADDDNVVDAEVKEVKKG